MTTIKNIDHNFSITDESIVQVQLNDCKLMVEIDAGQLTYAVLSKKNNCFLAFKSLAFENWEALKTLILNDHFLDHKAYSDTIFSIVNLKSTLVPNAFYDEEKKSEFLLFNHPVEADESIAIDDFRFFEAKNIFAINDDLLHLIENNFIEARLHHCSTPLIESLLLRNKNRRQVFVNANIHNQQFELTVIKNNQLQYCNAFPCPTAEDFIYYILFMYEQLSLNPESVMLELSGNIDRQSAFYNMADKHINKVEFAGRTDNSQFSYGFENLPAHYHLTLFDLNLCVS